MQPVDLNSVSNNNGWKVYHDPNNNMFYLKNDNGNRKPGYYTSRVVAEKDLYDYLKTIEDDARAKAERRALAEAPKKRGNPGTPQKKVLTPGKERNKGN